MKKKKKNSKKVKKRAKFTKIKKKFFSKNNKIKIIQPNLLDLIFNKYKSYSKPFFSIDKNIVGENHLIKLKKIKKLLKKFKLNYLFISAPENVAWLLNIRGYDNPYSPIPNCHLLINDKKKIFLIANRSKLKK